MYIGNPAILINLNGKIVIEPNFIITDTTDNTSNGLKHIKVLNTNINEVDDIEIS